MHGHSALFNGLAFETRLKIQNAIDVLIHRAIEEDRFAISCRFLRDNNKEAADTVDALTDP